MILKKTNGLKKFPNSRDGTGKASVIDLGSNSVKMVNFNVDSHNTYKPYHQESVRVKLAEGLVDGVLENGEKWQGIASKAVKGGLKLAEKQQDMVFETLEAMKGQLTQSASRLRKLFSNN